MLIVQILLTTAEAVDTCSTNDQIILELKPCLLMVFLPIMCVCACVCVSGVCARGYMCVCTCTCAMQHIEDHFHNM